VTKADKSSLENLIVKYSPKLKSFIRRRVKSSEDAEDIMQDVFYQMIKTVNTAMNPVEHAAAWLYRVAQNTIINRSVKKREERMPAYQNEDDGDVFVAEFSETLFDSEPSPSPETEYLRSLVWEELKNALAELPPEQREAYELTELDGLPVKEIAKITNIPVNTLLSRKHYAVLHLRKRMRQLYEDIVGC
jgi:RNA polymerase sigma factor (sigma-70 family)